MSFERSLDKKVVVITGAGGGLGTALVRQFAAQGCYIAAIVRRPESGKHLQQEFSSDKLSIHIADVADPDQTAAVFEEIVDKYGTIDYLFNNAAVYPKVNFLEETAREWLDAILTNLGGVSNCCKSALSIMIKSGFGRIYNLGSFADLKPIANSAAYSCSKGGIHGLTKAIAADIADMNIDVEVHEWNPGHVKTAMSDHTGLDPELPAEWAVEIAAGKIKPTRESTLFLENIEWQPPQSLKQRIKNKLLVWK